MLDKKIVKQSLLFSSLVVLYIALVATIMSRAEQIVGQGDKTVLAPIIFLLLLVVSVATMGILIFGKPIMLYMDGKKRDAVIMMICTVSCLAVFISLFLAMAAFLN